MNTERIRRITEMMKENGADCLLVSDPVVIRYICGSSPESGERLIALLIRQDGNALLILNALFSGQQPDAETVYYNDTDDAVALLSGYLGQCGVLAVDKNWPARFLLRLQELKPEMKYMNSSAVIDRVRQIKDPDEQRKMIAVSQLNDRVMSAFIPLIKAGQTELELAATVRRLYKEAGADGVSFDPICSFAGNAADPHHGPDDTVGKPGDCLVIDIGCMKDGYASDMTRTVFLGEASPRQKEIYEIVKEANRRGVEAARPGNRMCDVDRAARDYIESKGFGPYFTHRTGHSIGMEDHEWGDASSVNTDVIRPGQCFSVEPGIYLKDEKIGVRVEDLVLITEDGCRVLNEVSRELTVIPV